MTLSISDIKKSGKEVETIIYIYLLVTILCAAFGAVYELFSHGVFSYYMLYAFGVPLLGGVLPFYCLYYFRRRTPNTGDNLTSFSTLWGFNRNSRMYF